LRITGYSPSKKTLSVYLRYLEEAYFIIPLEKLSPKLQEKKPATKKIYPVDTGFHQLSVRFTDDSGTLMESAVAIELTRRKKRYRNLRLYKGVLQQNQTYILN